MTRILPLLLTCAGLLLSASEPQPALLHDIEIVEAANYVEVRLQVQNPPRPVVYRQRRDIVVDLPDCKTSIPVEVEELLKAAAGKLVSAVELSRPAFGDIRVTVRVTTVLDPFISRTRSGIALRFYRQDESLTTLAPGVSLRMHQIAGANGNRTIYELRLSREATKRLTAVSGTALGKPLMRPSEVAVLAGAEVVVNGGFFSKAGEHLSTFIENGKLVAPGVYPTRPMLAIDDQGMAHIGRFDILAPADGSADPCCCVEGERQFNVIAAIGAGPMLVEKGRRSITVEQDAIKPDIATGQRARTGVGLTRKGELVFVVVREDEPAAHAGVSLQELAELLLDAGAVTAMNLDGGGSSAIVVAGDLLLPDGTSERPVSNAWVLRADNSIGRDMAEPVAKDDASVAVELEAGQSQ